VKGVHFGELEDVADPVELAEKYGNEGADELVFYDITASNEGRGLFVDVLRSVASKLFIPLTVGGGVKSIADFEIALTNGADKVSVNSGAINNPSLISDAAKRYGSQCVVLSVDVKRMRGDYHVMTYGGKVDTGLNAVDWVRHGILLGAGEIVINSVDTDGVMGGFDIPMLDAFARKTNVPIIASGGAGSISDFVTLFKTMPRIDAGLAASIFHYGDVSIRDLKLELYMNGINVRTQKEG
ncbi:MAG: imidazole glycerol phosphate synthase cyclase subunit, partial [Firmicutes bacterium]|nr:imidazole glycerol phosphate synthase cyclase subunit [Bacillota bacterium]